MELYNYLITNDRKKIVEYADKLGNALTCKCANVYKHPTTEMLPVCCRKISKNANKKPRQSKSSADKNQQITRVDFKNKVNLCENKFQAIANITGAVSKAVAIVLIVFDFPNTALFIQFAEYLVQAYIEMISKN